MKGNVTFPSEAEWHIILRQQIAVSSLQHTTTNATRYRKLKRRYLCYVTEGLLRIRVVFSVPVG
jgi:hypothetical protein